MELLCSRLWLVTGRKQNKTSQRRDAQGRAGRVPCPASNVTKCTEYCQPRELTHVQCPFSVGASLCWHD